MAKSRNELIEENAKLTAENAMLTREAELDRRSSIADLIGSVIKTFLRWGFSFGIVFVVYLMINRLAGQVTFADIAVNFIGSFTFTHSIAGVAAVSGIIYGLRQNHLRRQSITVFSRRIEQLERRVDPNRTSSELTEKGLTNPKDIER